MAQGRMILAVPPLRAKAGGVGIEDVFGSTAVFSRADIVVDSASGEIIKDRHGDAEQVLAELAGKAKGRSDSDPMIRFSVTGESLQEIEARANKIFREFTNGAYVEPKLTYDIRPVITTGGGTRVMWDAEVTHQ